MSDTPTTVLLTFRDRIRKLSPPWLQTGLAEKLLYSIGVHCDAFADALIAGVKLRFPGYYDAQSLSLLGRERRIPRGRAESDESYAARLANFLTDHAQRGGPYAMLRQLHYYFQPVLFDIQLVYYNGRSFTRDADAFEASGGNLEESIQRSTVVWAPDSDAAKWARWWLFYYVDTWAVTPPTDAELAELRFIPRQWNAAHPLGTLVLFSSTSELWGWPPGHQWGESGTWGTSGTPLFYEVEP